MKLTAAIALLALSTSVGMAAIPETPKNTYTTEDLEWLAKNAYFEARNQGTAGILATAMVVMNRVEDKRFPNTIKDVVTQGPTKKSWKTGEEYPIRHKCHFSWYCDGKADTIKDTKQFNKILNVVLTYLENQDIIIDITDGATHYHADYVYPSWAKTKTRTTEIGDHIFYRWEK
jgi:spore germination cell wall hydrolase CwlJ-like protein